MAAPVSPSCPRPVPLASWWATGLSHVRRTRSCKYTTLTGNRWVLTLAIHSLHLVVIEDWNSCSTWTFNSVRLLPHFILKLVRTSCSQFLNIYTKSICQHLKMPKWTHLY